jgi:hypothetical protein
MIIVCAQCSYSNLTHWHTLTPAGRPFVRVTLATFTVVKRHDGNRNG